MTACCRGWKNISDQEEKYQYFAAQQFAAETEKEKDIYCVIKPFSFVIRLKLIKFSILNEYKY